MIEIAQCTADGAVPLAAVDPTASARACCTAPTSQATDAAGRAALVTPDDSTVTACSSPEPADYRCESPACSAPDSAIESDLEAVNIGKEYSDDVVVAAAAAAAAAAAVAAAAAAAAGSPSVSVINSYHDLVNLPLACAGIAVDNTTPIAKLCAPASVTCTAHPVDMIRERITQVLNDEALDDPFYVADLGEVIRQHRRWVAALPMVDSYYAVKCNPDPNILRALALLGTGFDCASKAEIAAVLDLGLGVNPESHIIYANPCKAASHIRYACSVGVRMMTFDNADELYKIKRHHANPLLVLRILTDDSRSLCRFGVKFGAALSQVKNLLLTARSLDLPVIGISFHVGSGCYDASAFGEAITAARTAFDIGASLGFDFSLLDIGGGFPGSESHTGVSFASIVDVVRPALNKMFSKTRVISEPGRYYASAAYTLAVNVHARRRIAAQRDVAQEQQNAADSDDTLAEDIDSGDLKPSFMYYINEGMYSSLNCIHFDHAMLSPRVLLKDGVFRHGVQVSDERQYDCSIWGPTCDSMDMITKHSQLPELNVGDWLYFDWMGAYTVSAATTFNGFAKCVVLWTNTEASNLIV